jgi:hypothetical protein
VVVNVGHPENLRSVVVPVAPTTQLAAAEALLDRGYGRAPQTLDATVSGQVLHEAVSPVESILSRLAVIVARRNEDEDDDHVQ